MKISITQGAKTKVDYFHQASHPERAYLVPEVDAPPTCIQAIVARYVRRLLREEPFADVSLGS